MTAQIGLQLSYAAILIALTFVIHGAMIFVSSLILGKGRPHDDPESILRSTGTLVVAALWQFLAHVISIWLWAVLYLRVGVSPTTEEALYFAMTTYTTLGFGDIVAPVDWRLLTGASSANGLLLFGLSAAALVEAAERLRPRGR